MVAAAIRNLRRILGIRTLERRVDHLRHQMDEMKLLSCKILINQMKSTGPCQHIRETEFKAFSQFGDDGIIQYLIHNAEIHAETFVEFGVEDYSECNTRFLLMNNNWRGLVMDGSKENIERIRQRDLYWRYDLTALHCWIDRENINNTIASAGFAGPLGLLSIDVDGNDYWIWESLNAVDPSIVIVEYNSVFGNEHAVTIPYDQNFNRTKAHYSNLYWGASLKALCRLGYQKGYVFVGCNNSGNNAYFVKTDRLGNVKPANLETDYVKSKYRESRDPEGRLTFLGGGERLDSIRDLPVYDIETGEVRKIKDLGASRNISQGIAVR